MTKRPHRPVSLIMSFSLMLSCGTASFWLASPARASSPGRNGGLVFTSFQHPSGVSSSFLETISSKGKGPKVLASCDYGCDSGAGDWSPDGHVLAYVDAPCPFECGLGPDIATVRPDGSHKKVLFSPKSGCCVWSPSWSPDGRRIAFIKSAYYYGLGRGDVYIMHSDGTHLKRIATKSRAEYELDWSSRNRLVVGARVGKRNDLFIMGPRGAYRRRLTRSAMPETQASWAPGGRKLLFVRGVRLGDLLSDGKVWKMRVRDQKASSIASGNSPTWAPNGTLIAFVIGRHAIHVIRPSGKGDRLWANPAEAGQISELDWRGWP